MNNCKVDPRYFREKDGEYFCEIKTADELEKEYTLFEAEMMLPDFVSFDGFCGSTCRFERIDEGGYPVVYSESEGRSVVVCPEWLTDLESVA